MAQVWRVVEVNHQGDSRLPLIMKVPRIKGGEDPATIVGFEVEQMLMPQLSGPHVPRYIARGDWTSATSLGAGALTTNAAVTASIGQTVFLNQRRTASTTTLAVSPAGASVVGRAVTLTATVVPSNGPGVPTGTVSFSDGTTPLGACTLDAAGTCSISVSNLAAGAHSLTAAYAQDVSFAGSSSSALAYTITRYPVGIAVSPSANPAQYGATVGFTVRVDATTGAAPTGTVSLFDGTAGVGTCALVAQDATSASDRKSTRLDSSHT